MKSPDGFVEFVELLVLVRKQLSGRINVPFQMLRTRVLHLAALKFIKVVTDDKVVYLPSPEDLLQPPAPAVEDAWVGAAPDAQGTQVVDAVDSVVVPPETAAQAITSVEQMDMREETAAQTLAPHAEASLLPTPTAALRTPSSSLAVTQLFRTVSGE